MSAVPLRWGCAFIMMNILDCFSRVRVYTNKGIKNEIPKGNKILALSKLAGISILVEINRGMTI
jgi:hypothetical protein